MGAHHRPPIPAPRLSTSSSPTTTETVHPFPPVCPSTRAGTLPLRVLHLFSGPSNRADGLASYLRSVGIECDDVDLTNGRDGDISNDAVWGHILAKIKSGHYGVVFGGPPCRTFSAARSAGPGPPVLRDKDHLYGFPKTQGSQRGLSEHHFEQIRPPQRVTAKTWVHLQAALRKT